MYIFNLSFDILATILATFPKIGPFFQYFGYSSYGRSKITSLASDQTAMIECVQWFTKAFLTRGKIYGRKFL
jgi:hypothetical protein